MALINHGSFVHRSLKWIATIVVGVAVWFASGPLLQKFMLEQVKDSSKAVGESFFASWFVVPTYEFWLTRLVINFIDKFQEAITFLVGALSSYMQYNVFDWVLEHLYLKAPDPTGSHEVKNAIQDDQINALSERLDKNLHEDGMRQGLINFIQKLVKKLFAQVAKLFSRLEDNEKRDAVVAARVDKHAEEIAALKRAACAAGVESLCERPEETQQHSTRSKSPAAVRFSEGRNAASDARPPQEDQQEGDAKSWVRMRRQRPSTHAQQ